MPGPCGPAVIVAGPVGSRRGRALPATVVPQLTAAVRFALGSQGRTDRSAFRPVEGQPARRPGSDRDRSRAPESRDSSSAASRDRTCPGPEIRCRQAVAGFVAADWPAAPLVGLFAGPRRWSGCWLSCLATPNWMDDEPSLLRFPGSAMSPDLEILVNIGGHSLGGSQLGRPIRVALRFGSDGGADW